MVICLTFYQLIKDPCLAPDFLYDDTKFIEQWSSKHGISSFTREVYQNNP